MKLYLLYLLYFLLIFKYISCDCVRNEITEISEEIKNMQKLSSIIQIGDENARYINFANFSNGTMIIEVSYFPLNNKRTFFGLNADGTYFFEKEVDHQYTIYASSSNKYRQYAENFCIPIKEGSKYKEYIVSIPYQDQTIELYDFDGTENKKIYAINLKTKLREKINSIRSAASNILFADNYYIVFLSWMDSNQNEEVYINNFTTKALFFNSKEIDNENNINVVVDLGYSVKEQISLMTSCFVSKSNYIWTMGFLENEPGKVRYYVIIYEPPEFNKEYTRYEFDTQPFYDKTFFKIVHLKDDIGVGIYYSIPENQQIAFPSLFIRYIDENEEINKLKSYSTIIDHFIINFNNKQFNYDSLLNDLVRVTDYKVLFTTMDLCKEILYIIIIEIFSQTEQCIRKYEMYIYNQYNFKFYQDIRTHIFENHIVLGFNFCKSGNCEESTNPHYSSFMIFSYPNSTNAYLNINDYLRENSGKTIDNISINLTNYIKIENNIFGYIFSKIEIVNLIGCDSISLKSKINNNNINKDYELSKNELLKIEFRNNIVSFNCSIYFRYVVDEPDYSDYQNYYIDDVLSTEFDYESKYNNNKKEYKSKISFYNIVYEYIKPIVPTTIILKEIKTTIINENEKIKTTEYITKLTTNKIIETEKITEIKKKTK